jgi:hypothetical protein
MYMQDPVRGLGGDFAPAGSSSLDTRRLLAFGDEDMPNYVAPEWAWTAADEASYSDTNIPGIDPNTGGSSFWTGLGTILSPFVTAATTVGVGKILGTNNSTYVIDPVTKRPVTDASGHPILANSTAGIAAAAAAKAAAGGTPSWVMPLAIGAGVLALVMLVGKKR